MKEVVCIKKPGFFRRDGSRYGPLYNELCTVVGQIIYPGYCDSAGNEWVFYFLEGYSVPDSHFVHGWRVFNSIHFEDVVSIENLMGEVVADEIHSFKPVHNLQFQIKIC